jgi:hypothetical protein
MLPSQEQVDEFLDNAVRNGYALYTWSSHEVAQDLIQCQADCEDLEVQDLLSLIESWQARKHDPA